MRPLALLALAVCGLALAPASAGAVVVPTVLADDAEFLYGSDAEVAAAMAETARLGIERVRLTAAWEHLTRAASSRFRPDFDANDPAAYPQDRWHALDRAVIQAERFGIKRMIDVGFWAPRWATSDEEETRRRTDIDPVDFARFAVAVARRYSGTFTPPGARGPLPEADMIALWNEPNHTAFLMPQWRRDANRRWQPASPGIYAAMVRTAYPAIKAVAPRTTVLVGNTSARGSVGGRAPVAPLAFVRALACVDRKLEPLRTEECSGRFTALPGDGFAHHPYALGHAPDVPSPPGSDDVRLADMPRLVGLLDRLADRGRLAPRLRDVYITEYGYETEAVGEIPGLSEAVQARYLVWAEYLLSRQPRVRMFSQFLLRDVPKAPQVVSDSARRPYGQFTTGLQYADGRPKLATEVFRAGLFAALRCDGVELWARLRLGPERRRFRLERSSDRGRTWRPLRTITRRGRGAWRLRVPARRGAVYRLVYREGGALVRGLPVRAKATGGVATRCAAAPQIRPR